MRLFKYGQFLNSDTINENLDKSKKYLKERFIILQAAKELGLIKGELGEKLKHNELRSVRLIDFSPEEAEQIKQKIREIKLTPDTIKNIERDNGLKDVRELKATVMQNNGAEKIFQLDRDNIGLLSNFVYFYFFENVPMDDLSIAYKKFLENRDIISRLQIDVDGKLTNKAFDLNFIDSNLPNNFEKFTDGLDRLVNYRKIKKIYDSLTPELKASYDESSERDKDKFASLAEGFDSLGKRADGTVDEKARKELWDGFFGQVIMRDGKPVYSSPLKRYKNIHEFIEKGNGYLNSKDIDGFIAFYKMFQECNSRLGSMGAEEIFNENGIFLINVKSFAANQMLNKHTSHCIKDSISQWNSYVETNDNIQYYIYNFNVPLRDNYSTIGITISQGKKVRACHNRADTYVSESELKNLLHKWERDYKINDDLWKYFKPLSGEEITKRNRAIEANRNIIKPGLTIAQIKQYVTEDGADINKDNGIALVNAVIEDNLEKVKYILSLGGLPNLRKNAEAAISKSKDIEMIKTLVEYGAEMTGDVFGSVVSNAKSLQYCLYAGLDPAFNSYMPFRHAFKGSWKGPSDTGEPYMESFDLLLKYMEKTGGSGTLAEKLTVKGNMFPKWAGEYGRVEVLEKFVEIGLFDSFTDKDWNDILIWVEIGRKMTPKQKEDTLKLLKDEKKKQGK